GRPDPPWSASADLRLSSFPLQRIPSLADRGVRGRVSGALGVRDLHVDPRAEGTLAIEGLQLGDMKYAGAQVAVAAGAGALDATARLDQTDGFAEARVKAGVRWGTALAPALDP